MTAEQRITGLRPAFGDGQRWCVEGCGHPQHPYVIAEVGDVRVLYGAYSGGGAFSIGHREVNEQHARLIAAAPEMLEALEAAFEVLAYHYDSAGRYHSLDRPGGETDGLCRICRVAVRVENLIASAKGVA